MTGIIIGTNREGSLSEEVAQFYKNKLTELNQEASLIDLKKLPKDFQFTALYGKKNPEFDEFQKKIDQCEKLIFVVPEYNNSYPGIVKSFIEGLRHPDTFTSKKIALVGVSTGVLGNAIGLSHLNDILSYLNANVLGLRVKLGSLDTHFSDGQITSETYNLFINRQIQSFLAF
jgi:NAD(P)H-dependent FMN reductase